MSNSRNLADISTVISNNSITANTLQANNGIYSSNNFTGTFTDGIVMDYVNGNGRISVGSADGLTIYNGGVGSTALLKVDSSGNVGIGTSSPSVLLTVNGDSLFGGKISSEIGRAHV